jgi:hypothetical protein
MSVYKFAGFRRMPKSVYVEPVKSIKIADYIRQKIKKQKFRTSNLSKISLQSQPPYYRIKNKKDCCNY